jgi:hypothetical protein
VSRVIIFPTKVISSPTPVGHWRSCLSVWTESRYFGGIQPIIFVEKTTRRPSSRTLFPCIMVFLPLAQFSRRDAMIAVRPSDTIVPFSIISFIVGEASQSRIAPPITGSGNTPYQSSTGRLEVSMIDPVPSRSSQTAYSRSASLVS